MPFTPFHMGLGFAGKQVLHKYMSLQLFALSQILIDLEPLILLSSGRNSVHGVSHTIWGATLVGLITVAFTPLLVRLTHEPIGLLAAFVGAFFGVYSHILIDAACHYDVLPFVPWHNSYTLEQTQYFCFWIGMLGLPLLWQYRGTLSKRLLLTKSQ